MIKKVMMIFKAADVLWVTGYSKAICGFLMDDKASLKAALVDYRLPLPTGSQSGDGSVYGWFGCWNIQGSFIPFSGTLRTGYRPNIKTYT